MSDITTIKNNLEDFTIAVQNNEKINVTSTGEWYYEGCLMRFIRWIFGWENSRIANVAAAFNRFLDEQECTPVRFSADPSNSQAATLNILKRTIFVFKTVMEERQSSSCIQTELNLLNRRWTALQYRFEKINGGCDKEICPAEVPHRLKSIAQQWKRSLHILDPHEIALTKNDIEHLKQAAQYPKFIKQLYNDKELQTAFFKWTIRDHNVADVFIEFPGKQKILKEAYLSLRIGRFKNHMLKIEKNNEDNVSEKHLTLQFEGKPVSILDERKQVTFSNNYTLSINDIYAFFKDKNHDFGNVEVFRNGVNNWAVHEMGRFNPATNSYDRIDLSEERKNNWWKQLPKSATISIEEAQQRYGKQADGKRWGARIVSTRENRDRSLRGNHVYIEIAIPKNNGSYSTFEFGKSSKGLPRYWWQYARCVAETVPGVITYADSSVAKPGRQHKGCGFTMRRAERKKVMDWIRKSIKRGHDGQMAYQLLTENCAKWAEEIRTILPHRKIPETLFLVPFSESEPEGFFGYIFYVVKQLPYSIQDVFFKAFFWPLGSTTSMTVNEDGKEREVSLSSMSPWRPGTKFRIPGIQSEQIENGLLDPIL